MEAISVFRMALGLTVPMPFPCVHSTGNYDIGTVRLNALLNALIASIFDMSSLKKT